MIPSSILTMSVWHWVRSAARRFSIASEPHTTTGSAWGMASGTSAAIGFCFGGGLAWESAAAVEGLDAGVVFYGGPPEEEVMARIHAPVAAYYGTNDVGLAPRIGTATADMARLGKEFEVEGLRRGHPRIPLSPGFEQELGSHGRFVAQGDCIHEEAHDVTVEGLPFRKYRAYRNQLEVFHVEVLSVCCNERGHCFACRVLGSGTGGNAGTGFDRGRESTSRACELESEGAVGPDAAGRLAREQDSLQDF